MKELDDVALLRLYAEGNSEEAFAAIVSRHVNMVYSVALRHTCRPHQAEEIAQIVFVLLAKKSRHLGKGVILSGWLYQTARLTAVSWIRRESRRANREREAFMDTLPDETESSVWTRIAPLLDTAMAGLNEADRQAVVLRFFDGRSMSEVGAAMGASEDAAKKRVHRAVEKLRLFFAKRGVGLSAERVTTMLFANSVKAAPVGLGKSVTAVAVASGAAAGGSIFSLIGRVLKGVMTPMGAMFGILLASSYFHSRSTVEDAKSPRERRFVVRMGWMRLTIGLLLFASAWMVRRSDIMHQPGAKPVAFAGFLFTVAVSSAVLLEYSNRRRRQIQIEDGTWLESDPATVPEHQGLLASLFQDHSKGEAHAAGSVAILQVASWVIPLAIVVQAVATGHWIRAGAFLLLAGIGAFRCVIAIRHWRRPPGFDARLGALLKGVGGCGLFTLLVYDLSWAHGHQEESNQWSIGFNLVVLLVYAATIEILIWRRRAWFVDRLP